MSCLQQFSRRFIGATPCENIVKTWNGLEPGETPSNSESHPCQSCFRLSPISRLADECSYMMFLRYSHLQYFPNKCIDSNKNILRHGISLEFSSFITRSICFEPRMSRKYISNLFVYILMSFKVLSQDCFIVEQASVLHCNLKLKLTSQTKYINIQVLYEIL